MALGYEKLVILQNCEEKKCYTKLLYSVNCLVCLLTLLVLSSLRLFFRINKIIKIKLQLIVYSNPNKIISLFLKWK